MLQHVKGKNAVEFIDRGLRRELRGPRLIQVYGVLPNRRVTGICMLVDGCNIHAASRKRLSDRGAAPPAYVQYSRISQKRQIPYVMMQRRGRMFGGIYILRLSPDVEFRIVE